MWEIFFFLSSEPGGTSKPGVKTVCECPRKGGRCVGCGSRAVYCPDWVVAFPGELRAPGLVSWKRDSASPGVILLFLILLKFLGLAPP